MHAEIVMIGTELLLGEITDTNAAYIGRALAEQGIPLYRKTTIGDNQSRIVHVLREALERADIVLTSGGLGPTEDDLTREAVAELMGAPLVYHQELFDEITARFARMKRAVTENNRKQATIPEGARPIANPNGTAPGVLAVLNGKVIASMPGVPRELYPMLDDSVLPFLRTHFGLQGTLRSRTLKVCGVGESRVDALIADIITSLVNPKIGLLASPEQVRIRISALAETAAKADEMIDGVDAQVRDRLPGLVMGTDNDTLESVVNTLFAARGWALATAETFTGGMLAQRFTATGAPSYKGGFTRWPLSTATRDPRALAEEALAFTGANCALALTPGNEPHSGVACFLSPEHDVVWDMRYPDLNELNQLRAAVIALEHVRRLLLGYDDEAVDAKAH